ncbi:MAG: hypothetical protein ACRC8P_00305 [Spiroplasma sp.]
MIGILLYWITAVVARKDNLEIKDKINTTNKKLILSFKYLKVSDTIKNNFDIKPAILKLFFWSFWINITLCSFTLIAYITYLATFIYNFLEIQISEMVVGDWPQIGFWIIQFLLIVFLIRIISATYKLSLRSIYRKNYSKVLLLDILTLNILNVVGTLIFIKNKKAISPLHRDYQISNSNLNSQKISKYLKLLWKIELFFLMSNVLLFAIVFILGYFISNNSIKIVCFPIILWTIIVFYAWSLTRIISMIIFQKMFNILLNNNSYYYLLSIIRFLVYMFGYYYFAILVNIFKFDQEFIDFLLQNW